MRFRDLERQYAAMKHEMDEALIGVASSGAYIMAPQIVELEKKLADYVGVRHCVSCANGTDAIYMALLALEIGSGDAVFVPDFTFFATAEAVARTGATPVFVDVKSSTFNIDSSDFEEKICSVERRGGLRPKAVIAVDLFGLPAEYDMIRDICTKYNLRLVEDAAQGFGGAIGSKKACSFGDIGTTSFFPAKPLGCYGDGGAMFTDDDKIAQLLRSLREHGKGENKYDNVRIGLNSRLDSIQAAILLVKLRHFDKELTAVNHVADCYNSLLRGKATILQIQPPFTSSWAQYTLVLEDRDSVRSRLHDAGIPTAVYYPRTMSRQKAFEPYKHLQQPCIVAESIVNNVLSLPMHPYLTDDEIEKIASLV